MSWPVFFGLPGIPIAPQLQQKPLCFLPSTDLPLPPAPRLWVPLDVAGGARGSQLWVVLFLLITVILNLRKPPGWTTWLDYRLSAQRRQLPPVSATATWQPAGNLLQAGVWRRLSELWPHWQLPFALVCWQPEQCSSSPKRVLLLSCSDCTQTHAKRARTQKHWHLFSTYSPWNKKKHLGREWAVCHITRGGMLGALDRACEETYGPHERNTCLFEWK